MRFFPKEICEKLIKIGCVSESGLSYSPLEHMRNAPPVFSCRDGDVFAFTLLDFIDTEPYAFENCKNILIFMNKWNEKYSMGHMPNEKYLDKLRYSIIKSTDGIAYVTALLTEVGK